MTDSSYHSVGQAVPKLDAPDKVTGRARYVADHHPHGLLHGKVVRSTRPHARIIRVDTSAARALPGVKAVITAADAPRSMTGPAVKDHPFLAVDVVRHIGEPIAAIAATTEDIAEEAAHLVQVEYEDLPAVFDPIEALAPDAPVLHPDLASYAPATTASQRDGNTLNQARIVRGDPDAAFDQADYVFEERFTTQPVHHAYIETRETIAEVDANGRVTVWASTQGPFNLRDQIASALQVGVNDVRVIGATVGGAFGGKYFLGLEAICAVLAKHTGRPVKLSMTRDEEFIGGELRHPAFITLKSGVMADGTIVALQGEFLIDSGAYASWAPMVVTRFSDLQGAYRIDNVRLEGRSVYTNNVVSGMHRAPGAPQASFGIESHIDTIATGIGLDPLEVRRRNGVREGDTSPTNAVLRNVALPEVLDRADAWMQANPLPEIPGRLVGRGIACGHWATQPGRGAGPQASSCIIRMNEDGTFVLSTGAMDLGTGMNTVLAQIAGEGLGVGTDRVTLVAADTDTTPYEGASGGSLGTYRSGTTVQLAAEAVRRQIVALAGTKLEANPDDLDLVEGRVVVKGSPDRGLTLKEVAALAQTSLNGPIVGTATQMREELLPNMARNEADAPTYSLHIVDLAVDPRTGQIDLLRYHAVHDVGFALNPVTVEGQLEGGISASLGFALLEHVILQNGQPLTTNLVDYKIPTSLDSLQITTDLIEERSDYGPYGAKGVGEPPVIPVAAAVANAVFNATGVRIRDLPITPEKVRSGLAVQSAPTAS